MVGWNGTMAEADRVGFPPEQSGMLGRLGMTMREYTLDEVAKTYATKDDLHGQFVSGVFAGMCSGCYGSHPNFHNMVLRRIRHGFITI